MNNDDIMSYNGEIFLDILYREMYNNLADSYKRGGATKEESIKRYLDRIEEMHEKARYSDHKKEMIKELYYDKYVVKKENLPYLNDEEKKGIIEAQKKSLSKWIDYLTDENTKYPMWAKYWVFQQMLKMGTYDEMSGKYTRRTKETTKPFVEANPEIIAKCIGNIIDLIGEEKQNRQQIRKKIGDVSFEKMYIEYQKKIKKNIKSNKGKWIKYNQGNIEEAKKLAKSLDGYNTGWCTASENMAIDQVCGGVTYPGGDFYVYYTLDENNEYKVPRIAIRLDGHDKIGEIRGIEENQNIEEEMVDALETKLKEMKFLNAKEVDEKLEIVDNLKELFLIKEKVLNNIQLEPQEVMDLYTKRFGFGWSQEPLVDKLLAKRSIAMDYQLIKGLDIKDIKNFIDIKAIHLILSSEEKFINEEEVALELVKTNGLLLKIINPKIANYKEVAYAAFNQSKAAICFMDQELDGYSDLAMMAVMRDGLLLKYINPKIANYKEVVYTAVHQCPDAIQYLSPDVDGYSELALFAVQQEGKLLSYINPNTKNYRNIVLEAVRNNPYSMEFVSPEIEGYEEIATVAVHKDGYAIRFIDSKLPYYRKLALDAVRQDGEKIEYVDPRIEGYEEIVKEAFNQNKFAIDFIRSDMISRELYEKMKIEVNKRGRLRNKNHKSIIQKLLDMRNYMMNLKGQSRRK